MDPRIERALDYAFQHGGTDGSHHKMWLIDQMVRALTGCPIVEVSALDYHGNPYTYNRQGESEEYKNWVAEYKSGDDGPETYDWDTGTPP